MSVDIPVNINSLQKLIKLPITNKCVWNVFAYCINNDIMKKDGTLDDDRALVFLLGSFEHFSDAEQHVKNVIEQSGYGHIIISKYGMPVKITTKRESDVIENITTDMQGKIINMDIKEYELQKDLHEKKITAEAELLKECKEEDNFDSIEYYKRKAYLVTKYLTNANELKQKSTEYMTLYEKEKKLLKKHLELYPKHESDFLPYLKLKLLSRGEADLYNNIEYNYMKYRQEIIN